MRKEMHIQQLLMSILIQYLEYNYMKVVNVVVIEFQMLLFESLHLYQ